MRSGHKSNYVETAYPAFCNILQTYCALGNVENITTGSCSILQCRIEISTTNENEQTGPTI